MASLIVRSRHPAVQVRDVRDWKPIGQPTVSRSLNDGLYESTFEVPEEVTVSASTPEGLGANEPPVTVTGARALQLAPTFTQGAGQTKVLFQDFYSHHLQNHRNIYAYLPPGYDENPYARYPVLYFHDGQNLFEGLGVQKLGSKWQLNQVLDHLIGTKQIPPVVAVAIEFVNRFDEYGPVADYGSTPRADAYVACMTQEIKPEVEKALRVRGDARHTGVVGSSCGGIISLYAAIRAPEVFSRVVALSPASQWGQEWLTQQLASQQLTFPPLEQLWVSHGVGHWVDAQGTPKQVQDGAHTTERLVNALRGTHAHLRYQTYEGNTHSEEAWRGQLHHVLPMVLESWKQTSSVEAWW